jgi:hypothetical protein
MHEQIYSDGIGAIVIANGVVRIDFVSLAINQQDASGNPKAEFQQRVVLSLEGFARSLPKIQEATQALVRLGVIQPQRGGEQPQQAQPLAPSAGPMASAPADVPAKKPPFP